MGPIVAATSPLLQPSPFGLGMAADGQGWLYALGPELWLEDPRGVRTRLFAGEGLVEPLAVDPRLRFVVVAETILPALAPGTPPIPVAPQLVSVSLGAGGEKRVLLPATPGLKLRQVALSPNGRWLALPIDRDDTRPDALRRLDLETPGSTPTIWQSGIQVRDPAWSPDGQHLAFLGGGQAWTLGIGEDLPRSVSGGSVGWLGYAPDGKLVVIDGDPLTFDGRLHGRILGAAGDPPVTFDWRVGPEGTIAEPRALAPVGTKLLVEVRSADASERRSVVLDLRDGELTSLPPASRAPRWRSDGTLACDGDARDQPVACEIAP